MNITETIIDTNINTSAATPIIITQFPVQGDKLPADHGYALYAAISKTVAELHQTNWLGIEQISGISFDKGIIVLPQRNAQLRLRLPSAYFGRVLPLAGKRLEVDGFFLRLGIPLARPIMPARSLYSKIVTIRNHTEVDSFLQAAQIKLAQLGVSARLELPRAETNRQRRIITIHGKRVVGFPLVAHDLSDEDSVKLQSHGIGGRRAMGCGIFNPISNG
jgi:CRISPR-associated protein Cas6